MASIPPTTNSPTSNKIIETKQVGGSTSIFTPLFNSISYLNHRVMYLNNSKFFAGIVMILLNVGSKFIQIQFSKSTEEYMKWSVSKQLLVFAMAWMGTRDIYTALGLTAVFTILSEFLFNEESHLCIVPHKYRILDKLIDTNDDGLVTEPELAAAISVLEKAKREKQQKHQKETFKKFDFQKFNYDK
uniref:EF-hand domain-containing protein n=1 Tax=viral metagenome TaxID=1070528 RepID=A0A6C0ARS5_9ZZZZ